MTVLEAIQRSTEFLSRKGLDSARLNAELLLAHALQMKRMQLYLNFERELTPDELECSRGLVKRRGGREPLQLIVGNTSFCDLEIAVGREALIPRPETELLAETAWKWLNAQAGNLSMDRPVVLDWGTGTGCIALAIAKHTPAAQVMAVDISAAAIQLARRNAAANGLQERVTFLEGDGFGPVDPETKFHLIVSNPPYIPAAEIPSLEPEVRDHDPLTALDGGADGLTFYRRLASEAGRFLAGGGKLMVEFGDNQADAIKEILQEQKWVVEAVIEDYTRRPRILIASHTNG